MTVNSIQETQDRVVSDLDIQQKSKDFSLPEISMPSVDLTEKKGVREAEMDRESGESSDDVDELLKSVEKWRRYMSKIGIVHSQVLKIREEDSHLDEDICEGLSAKNKITSAGVDQNMQLGRVSSAVDVVLFSRRILPSSPLSGKASIKALP